MENYVNLNFNNNFEGEEKILIEKVILLQESLLQKDIKKLSRLMSNKFILVRGSGRKESKLEFLTDIKNDILNYQQTDMSKPTVSISDNHATIKTKVNIKTELSGAQVIWDLKSKFILKKIEDEWYFTQWDTS